MTNKLIRTTIVAAMILFAGHASAQDEYRSEIGILGGVSYYQGDANTQLFANNQLAYGLLYRHKLDTRLAISGSWNKTLIAGMNGSVPFSNDINAFDVCGEFNFFDYENKVYRPNSKKHTLYLFAGIGGTLYPYSGATTFSMSMPFGLGYKIMLGKRFNLNFIWSNRWSFSDKLEGVPALNDAYGLNGTNNFNNDLLSTMSIGLTYNIFKKGCKCVKTSY